MLKKLFASFLSQVTRLSFEEEGYFSELFGVIKLIALSISPFERGVILISSSLARLLSIESSTLYLVLVSTLSNPILIIRI